MLIGSIRCRKRFTGRLIEKQICSEIRERPTLKVNIFKPYRSTLMFQPLKF